MSTGTKTPYATILPIAQKLADRLSPYCQRIEIAGSLRRRSAMVGDIELVAIPTLDTVEVIGAQLGLFDSGPQTAEINRLLAYTDKLMATGRIGHAQPARWGDRMRMFVIKTSTGRQYNVDLFMATPATFASIFLIRTGSEGFTKFIVTPKSAGGAMPAGMQQRDGLLYRNGLPLAIETEQQYFDAIGLDFVEPGQRKRGVVAIARNGPS